MATLRVCCTGTTVETIPMQVAVGDMCGYDVHCGFQSAPIELAVLIK
jgi:hypothetical protein